MPQNRSRRLYGGREHGRQVALQLDAEFLLRCRSSQPDRVHAAALGVRRESESNEPCFGAAGALSASRGCQVLIFPSASMASETMAGGSGA